MKIFKKYPIPFIFNICAIIIGTIAVLKGVLAGAIFVVIGIVILTIIIVDEKKKAKNPPSTTMQATETANNLDGDQCFFPIYKQVEYQIGIDLRYNRFVKKEYNSNNPLGYTFSFNTNGAMLNYHKNLSMLAELSNSYLYLNFDDELKKAKIIVLPKDKNQRASTYEAPENVFMSLDASQFNEYIKKYYGVELTQQAMELYSLSHNRCVRQDSSKKIMLQRNMNEIELDEEYSEFIKSHRCVATKGDIWDKTSNIYLSDDLSVYRVDTYNSQIYKHREEYPIVFMTHKPTKIETYDELQKILAELDMVSKFPNLNRDNWQSYYAYSPNVQ